MANRKHKGRRRFARFDSGCTVTDYSLASSCGGSNGTLFPVMKIVKRRIFIKCRGSDRVEDFPENLLTIAEGGAA